MKQIITLLIVLMIGLLLFSSCEKSRCNDGIQNGDEVDIDCGGECRVCFTCEDGYKNQGETGIDCGGPCPNKCSNEWTNLPFPEAINHPILYFLNENVGYVGSEKGLFKTTDGGKNWSNVRLPSYTSSMYVRFIFFLNEKLGFVDLYNPNWLGDAYTLRTEDGGATWAPILETTEFNNHFPVKIVFLDAQNAIMTLQATNDAAYLLKSTNAGKDWSLKMSVYELRRDYPIDSDDELLPRHIVPLDNGTIYAFIEAGTIKSLDNGETWQFLPGTPGTKLQGGVKFFTAQSGIVIRGRSRYREVAIYKTTDGGTSWQQLTGNFLPFHTPLAVNISSPEEWRTVYEISTVFDGTFVFSYGARTLNSGKTWTNYGLTNSSGLPGVKTCFFVGAETCYCMGTNGYLVKLNSID